MSSLAINFWPSSGQKQQNRTWSFSNQRTMKFPLQSVKFLQGELFALPVKRWAEVSGGDCDAALESPGHHHTDKQTCDFSLWNTHKHTHAGGGGDLHIWRLTDACRDCPSLSQTLPVYGGSVSSHPVSTSAFHCHRAPALNEPLQLIPSLSQTGGMGSLQLPPVEKEEQCRPTAHRPERTHVRRLMGIRKDMRSSVPANPILTSWNKLC